MTWKKTKKISRGEAKELILKRMQDDFLSNKELENLLVEMGYGWDKELDYYGHFLIVKNG